VNDSCKSEQRARHEEQNNPMNMRWFFLYLIALTYSFAQGKPQAIPEARIVRLTLNPQNVTVLHLRPGYVSCVRLPEDISTVVLGNPSTFKAEHSDAEPRLVSLKPTTPSPGETNAFITTKTGREVALHLVSSGAADNAEPVDFILEYDRPRSFLVEAAGSSLIVSRTESVGPQPASSTKIERAPIPRSPELLKQQSGRKPHWTGKQLRVAVGPIRESDQQMVVAFSVLNAANRTIEVLPPQVQLTGISKKGRGKPVKAEPLAIKDYAITVRRLRPGARADAIVMFERPSFKESSEQMFLQIAEAAEVDRPVLVPIAFVAPLGGDEK
jgi:hypothetical protein